MAKYSEGKKHYVSEEMLFLLLSFKMMGSGRSPKTPNSVSEFIQRLVAFKWAFGSRF
jgi:hypothetical protein